MTAAMVLIAAGAAAQDPPRFTAAVDVLSLDVTVIDAGGRPVTDLVAADFTARVDGVPRTVLSAEWVPLVVAGDASVAPPPPGYSSNAGAGTGRLILFVIDQPNIRFGGTASLQPTIEAFIDNLPTTDRIAAVGIGPGGASTPFTADRARVKQAIGRMSGLRQSASGNEYNLSLTEALEMYRLDTLTFSYVIARECRGRLDADYQTCVQDIERESHVMAEEVVMGGRQTYSALQSLLSGLSVIDAAKTIVFVSEGFILEDDAAAVAELGALASAARTSIYALKLEDRSADVASRRALSTSMSDSLLRVTGIETLTHLARGAMFNALGGARGALDRIETELSGYYLLGLEAVPADSDGRRHAIGLDVARRGTTARWRREMAGDAGRMPERDSRQVAIDALNSPLMLSALPLRVSTFSLRDPDPEKVQVLLHAAVGEGYPSPGIVSLAYTFTDADGRIVESQAANARLSPVMVGVPSPLQYRVAASVPPGEYVLRLAVTDGDRVGTVEHTVHARLAAAGSVRISELLLGGPVEGRDVLIPSVGHSVNFGLLHGYVEAYGPDVDDLSALYEVAPDETSEALLSAEVKAVQTGSERAIFAQVIPVRRLPAGDYVLRATIRSGRLGVPIATLTRAFEVAPPPVLMSPAEGGGGSLAAGSAEVFLPVDDNRLARPFSRQQAARRDVVEAFRGRVNPEAAEAFDRGVELLGDGAYGRAEASFKSAVQVDADSTAPIAYLGATFAAAGKDLEAAGAWQTSLIDGDDLPQIYLWLGDALIRARDLVQARTILEEAVQKWPADVRFAKPLSLVYASFGLGREAVRMVQRHLEAEPEDVEALVMAVEWTYHLHTAGATAQTPAEDVRRARTYADAYIRTKGPQAALVQQWMSALEDTRR